VAQESCLQTTKCKKLVAALIVTMGQQWGSVMHDPCFRLQSIMLAKNVFIIFLAEGTPG